jgi:hypothetical protein
MLLMPRRDLLQCQQRSSTSEHDPVSNQNGLCSKSDKNSQYPTPDSVLQPHTHKPAFAVLVGTVLAEMGSF